jgi:hypothetical protein
MLTGTRNFTKDALEGKDIKESAKERFDETKKDLKSKFSLSGKGINKRNRKRKMIQTLTKKIKRDIFD